MFSMNILYLDTLFFVNFICDYFLLLCSAKCSSAEIRRIPIALAAALGGGYACLACLPAAAWLGNGVGKLSCGILLALISFGNQPQFFRSCLFFLCISALFGGIFSALSLSVNGMAYLPIDGKVMAVTFCAIYALLSVFFRRLPQTARQQTHQIAIEFLGRTLSFTALRDTGNTLYDPITNTPVLVCGFDILQQLFPEISFQTHDPYTLFYILNDVDGCAGHLKLIPYETLSGHGFFLAIRPNSVTVDGKPETMAIAFSPAKFSSQHTYQAIY